MDQRTTISLECIFCSSTKFDIPEEDYKPKQGESIKCGNCGKFNDFTSIEKVVHIKGEKWAKNEAQKLMNDMIKKINKNFKL
ncbi:MAG: hypothetical protein ACJAZX_001592 [Rickettsiales bacterium]|jgi:hypothetical protein